MELHRLTQAVAAQPLRLKDAEPERRSAILHRRRGDLAAVSRTVGLSDDGDEPDPAAICEARERVERRDRERRRPQEQDARPRYAPTSWVSSGSTAWRSSRERRRST